MRNQIVTLAAPVLLQMHFYDRKVAPDSGLSCLSVHVRANFSQLSAFMRTLIRTCCLPITVIQLILWGKKLYVQGKLCSINDPVHFSLRFDKIAFVVFGSPYSVHSFLLSQL